MPSSRAHTSTNRSMGKQNRSDKAAATKSCKGRKVKHKARFQQCSSSLPLISNDKADLEQYEWNKEHGPKRLDQWTILIEDTVWFVNETKSFDPSNPDTYRGVVKDFVLHRNTSTIDSYYIQPFYLSKGPHLRIAAKKVRRHVDGWLTLPHTVGDKVVYCEIDSVIACEVKYLWPIWMLWEKPGWTRVAIPTYSCEREDDNSRLVHTTLADLKIHETPSYRFKVGDIISINPNKVEWLNWNGNRCVEGPFAWIEGKVTALNVRKPHSFLLKVYQCSVIVDGQARRCHIPDDKDEAITSFRRSARDRLIDSIHQGCSFVHISQLIEQSKLDVSMIKNLVLALAIQNGSYDMLLWIDKNLLPLTTIEDEDGNLLQHQIASSPEAASFMQALRKVTDTCLFLWMIAKCGRKTRPAKSGRTFSSEKTT